jgi:ubiquinone/menaquinone biosynthesis C-methylase UbiE
MAGSRLQMDLVRESFEPLADYYARSKAHTDRESLDRVRELAETDPNKIALDVATGPGLTAMHLAPRVRQVVGLDLTRRMLAKAAELSRAKGIGNIDLVQGNVYSLPFPDETFDIVTSRRAPHHFPDLLGAIRSIGRVVKRGGLIVIEDRSVPEDDFVDRTMNELDVLHDRSHVRDHRPSEWKAVMVDAGLKLEALEEFSRVWPLTSLTETARPDDKGEIERRVRSLDEAGRKRMGVCEIDGVPHIRHWYVVLKARRP